MLQALSRQLGINDPTCILAYAETRQRQRHAGEIQERYSHRVFTDSSAGFRLARWLYALCWTGTDRPGELFNRATTWLLTHKVLLPGVTVLERFIAQLRSRVEERLWLTLPAAAHIPPSRIAALARFAHAHPANRGSSDPWPRRWQNSDESRKRCTR